MGLFSFLFGRKSRRTQKKTGWTDSQKSPDSVQQVLEARNKLAKARKERAPDPWAPTQFHRE